MKLYIKASLVKVRWGGDLNSRGVVTNGFRDRRREPS